MDGQRTAVVDGANVAFLERTRDDKPKVSNIVAVCQALEQEGYTSIIIVDASLRHQVDDPDQLEGLFDKGVVRQAPAGTQADFFVLATADIEDALVVSNDTFEEYQRQYPWIADRRVTLMIIGGEVILHFPSGLQARHAADPAVSGR